jgi:hypothetical protein
MLFIRVTRPSDNRRPLYINKESILFVAGPVKKETPVKPGVSTITWDVEIGVVGTISHIVPCPNPHVALALCRLVLCEKKGIDEIRELQSQFDQEDWTPAEQ